MTAIPPITVDMNLACAECGQVGAVESGICLGCTSDAISGRNMRSREGRAVKRRMRDLRQDRENAMRETESTENDLGNNSAQSLVGFIERIENLESDKAETSEAIKAEYAMAASAGFDKKALRQIIKERKLDMSKTAELRATVETYRKALGQFADTELGQWATAFAAAETTAMAEKRE